jgi:hypothetical protein
MMCLFGALVFTFFYLAFFNVNTPPVILFLFFFQWFFNQGQLVQALRTGQSLSAIYVPANTIETVFYLGMIGTALFFLGVYIFFRKLKPHSLQEFRRLVLQMNVNRLLTLYLLTYPMLTLAVIMSQIVPGLAQPLVMLSYFKWSVFFLFFIAVPIHNKYKIPLIVIILFEFASGFGVFWASFKDVVYIAFVSYWMFYFRGNVLLRWTLPVIILLMVYLGSIWSTIKQDYRNFLTKAPKAQITLSRQQTLDKFTEMVSSVSEEDLNAGFDALIVRMSWIGAFNKVYNRVPARVPHEDGQLWAAAVTRPFLPRLFFPNKTRLTDSQELNYYSGLNVDEKNTSISLSTIAGSYVDYGDWGMHVPLFLFGLFFGWIYRKIFVMSANFVFAHALSIPLIFIININEQSINRMVSSLVLYFLVVWFICRFLQKPLLRFITQPVR